MSGFMCNTSVNVKLITVFKCAMFKKKKKKKQLFFLYSTFCASIAVQGI